MYFSQTGKKKKMTGQTLAFLVVWNQRLSLMDACTSTLINTSGFSFKCLSLYIFSVHPHSDNRLFIPPKSGPAPPQPSIGTTSCNMSSV